MTYKNNFLALKDRKAVDIKPLVMMSLSRKPLKGMAMSVRLRTGQIGENIEYITHLQENVNHPYTVPAYYFAAVVDTLNHINLLIKVTHDHALGVAHSIDQQMETIEPYGRHSDEARS